MRPIIQKLLTKRQNTFIKAQPKEFRLISDFTHLNITRNKENRAF